jgi:cytochrome c oxidase subunit 3
MSTATVSAGHAHEGHGHEGHGDSHAHHPFHAHHFDTLEQQFDSGKLGTWLFLVTEVLFFSGLFVAYIVYRAIHPEIFEWGHVYLNKWLGGLNTAVLIFSSLTMAWGVRAAQKGQRNLLVAMLSITFLCAGAFLVVKYFEYTHKFHMGLYPQGMFNPVLDEPHGDDGHGAGGHSAGGHDAAHPKMPPPPPNAGVFFSIYYCMTGLHAIHIIAGMGLIAWLIVRAAKGHFGPQYYGPVDYVGLYWHLVDLIWIYLFPLLYLIH